MMRGLGLEEDLRKLFHFAQMEAFFDKRPPTYYHLTIEFMSTLQVKKESKWVSYLGDILVGQCVEREGSPGFLNECFGCPPCPNHQSFYEGGGFNQQEWWSSLVNDGTERAVYVPSASKGTAIRNPVMKYLEKIVSNTILGRFEGGSVGEK